MTLIGAVIATIVFILLVVILVIFCVRRRRLAAKQRADAWKSYSDDVKGPTLPSNDNKGIDINPVMLSRYLF